MTDTDQSHRMSGKRLRLDIGAIVLILIVINAIGTFRCLDGSESFPDQVAAYDRRFAKLAPFLKPGQPVGYLADQERHPIAGNGLEDRSAIDLVSMRRFSICQFVLAPTILVHGCAPSRIVGNFSSSESAKAGVAGERLKILQDCGNGAVLCGHIDKQ